MPEIINHSFFLVFGIDDQKIAWKVWDNLYFSKRVGRLDFQDLPTFNYAMLAKQGWRYVTIPNSLVARVFKGKYFPNSSFLQTDRSMQLSCVSKCLLVERDALFA